MNENLDRIRVHIDGLLQNAPRTKAMEDLREELYSGCRDKYNDLCAAGSTPNEAFAEVIAGIGDVDELVTVITKAKEFNPALAQENRRRRALYICTGIALFVASCIFAIFLSEVLHYDTFSGLLVFAGLSAATILIVYGIMTTPYKYEKQEDTIVEDLKTNMAQGGKRQRLLGAASSTLWTLTAALYLFISFLSGDWHVTWMIFLLAAVLQTLMKAYFSPAGRRGAALAGSFWTTVTLLYFIISFWTMDWHITWAIFIVAAAVQQIVRLLSIWRE